MKAVLSILAILIFAGPLYRPVRVIAKPGQHNQFKTITAGLRTGDVILRKGKGFISELFRKSSMYDQKYSHAGIIQVTGKGVFVIHVLGGDVKTTSNLIEEPIAAFCDSHENTDFAVYRYPFLEGKEQAVNRYLNQLVMQGTKFDEQFDLTSDSALYCTELVYKMCLKTANQKLPFTDVNGRIYVGLDNLYRHPHATLIAKQTY